MKKTLSFFTNKYILTSLAFGVWMLLFDQNDWKAQRERNDDLTATEQNIKYLNEEIARLEYEHKQLTSNPERLEQFARENYRMKRDNEDVYVVEPK